MAKICWAHALGGCDEKMSREHIVTEKVFQEHSRLKINNTKASPRGTIELTRKNYVSKILCKNHNSNLSILDQEAINLMEVFKDVHGKIKNNYSCDRNVYRINKELLERWLLKTLINHIASDFFEFKHPIRRGGEIADKRLLDIAFGNDSFSGYSGGYLLDHIESIDDWGDHFNFTPMTTEKGVVCGMVLKFCAIWFVLWVTEKVPILESAYKMNVIQNKSICRMPLTFKIAETNRSKFYIEFL